MSRVKIALTIAVALFGIAFAIAVTWLGLVQIPP